MGRDIHLHVEQRTPFDPNLERDVEKLLAAGDRAGVMRRLREMRGHPLLGWRYVHPNTLKSLGVPMEEPDEWSLSEDRSITDAGRRIGDLPEGTEVDVHRNYILFQVLSGSGRWAYDFRVPTICRPRQFPVDVTPEVSAEYAEWGGGAHSASWLTLDEVTAYPWTSLQTQRPGTYTYSLAEDCGQFLDITAKLLELDRDPRNVRLVFWYDS